MNIRGKLSSGKGLWEIALHLDKQTIILFIFRNVKPAFHKFGLYGGLMYTGLFYIVGRGKEPWTFKHEVLGTLFYTWNFYDDLQLYKK